MKRKITEKNIWNHIGKIAALILFTAVVALLPIKEAYAAEQVIIDKIKYELDAGSHTAVVVKYDWEVDTIGDVIIPSQITHNEELYTVTEIKAFAFQNCHTLTSISIPSSVTEIGSRAFQNCGVLTSVNIPAGLTEIKNHTFCECTQLNSVTIEATSQLERIEMFAFGKCTSLTSITLPASVTFVDFLTFDHCYSLQIQVETGNANYSDQGGTLYNKDKTVLIAHPAGGSCVVADTVTEIGERAFYENQQLQSVVLPEGLETIGDEAFWGVGLETVSLPSGLQTIGEKALFICPNLKEVYYPANLDISSAGINYSDNATSIISYTSNMDDTVTITVENLADGVTETSLIPVATMDVTCSSTVVGDVILPDYWEWSSLDANTPLEYDTPVTIKAVYKPDNKIKTSVTITKHQQHIDTVIKNAKSPSCKETGYTGDTFCNDCSTTLRTGSVIGKTTNHSFDGGVVTTQASETQKGVKTYTCIVCGITKTEEIPMIEIPIKEEPKEEPDTEVVEPEPEKPVVEEDKDIEQEEVKEEEVVDPEVTEPVSEEIMPEEEKLPETSSTVIDAEPTPTGDFNKWFVVVPAVIVLGAGAGVGVFVFKKRK